MVVGDDSMKQPRPTAHQDSSPDNKYILDIVDSRYLDFGYLR